MPNLKPDILITKVMPPFLRRNIVHRERLLDRLSLIPETRLWLVSGPAGYGKTTLLADWQQLNKQQGVVSAWLSLDTNDNEPQRFLRYLSASIQMGLEENVEMANALEVLAYTSSKNMEAAMTVLINSLSQFHGTFLLIIDDYHFIDHPAIHHAMGFLLDNLPSSLKIAIGTRADPPLPIGRLRSRGQLLEIRSADLRFSPHEADDFLSNTLQLNLNANEMQLLDQLTEGWAAGLQLCGLSLRNWPEWTDQLLREPTRHRPVMVYLREEVFQKLPGQIQSFLLATCLLEELNIELCSAVCKVAETLESNAPDRLVDAQSSLEWLDHANLFVIPLDPYGKRFRYHSLFAEFLQDHLARFHQDWVKEINRKASEWYWQQRNIDQAVRCAIKCGDSSWIIHLIEQSAILMLVRSELAMLKNWLAQIPRDLLDANPFLSVISGWVFLLLGELNRVEPNLCGAELALDSQTPASFVDIIGYSITPQIIHCHILALRAFVARISMDWETAIHLSQQALQELPLTEQVVRSTLILNLGQVYKETLQVEACGQYLTETVEAGRISGNLYIQLTALVLLGQQAVLQGGMDEAMAYYSKALSLGYQKDGKIVLPAVSFAEAWLGDWYFIRNQLEEAQEHLDRAIQLAELCGEYGILHDAYMNRVKLSVALGDLITAQIFTDKADQIPLEGIPASKEWIEAHKVLVWLAQGKIDGALAWIERVPLLTRPQQITRSSEKHTMAALSVYLKAAEAGLLEISRLESCLDTVDMLLTAADTDHRTTSKVDFLVIKADILQLLGQGSESRKIMMLAHRLADPHGWARVFLDAPVKIDIHTFTTQYLSTLTEPLSERELDLLRLIVGGASNQEIASRLFITVGTVKSHLNHVFGKLGVKNRTEAAARARFLRLV